MNTSPEIGELAKALAQAQGEMKNPEFDSQNTFFKRPDGSCAKYASLAAVRNAVIPVLAKHNIGIAQELTSTTNPPAVGCTTRLLHSSGQWMDLGPFWIPVGKADAQGFVAAGTYAKRASMQSVACLVGDDDDDGEEAVGRGARKPAKKEPAGVSDDTFPPTDRPIGKPVAAPAHTAASLEAMDMKGVATAHFQRFGKEVIKAEIEALGGDFTVKADKGFALDASRAKALRDTLIGQLVGPVAPAMAGEAK